MSEPDDKAPNKALNYGRYLEIDALLGLQKPRSDEHDELLFIVIHQVYELWFKQLLHELSGLRVAFDADDAPRVLHLAGRVRTIFKTLVAQVDILETMTPLSFNAFRARLESSSGFQSAQFRAVEFLLGHKRPALLAQYADGGTERTRLETLLAEPSVYDAFLGFLRRAVSLPDAQVDIETLLLQVYRTEPNLAQVCERLVDIDEGLQEWRYRHVKMVERVIGARVGTGGSAGAAYLRETLFKPLFAELWSIRSQL